MHSAPGGNCKSHPESIPCLDVKMFMGSPMTTSIKSLK